MMVRGSMVVITDGTDQADRVKEKTAVSVGKSFSKKHLIIAVGVGGETSPEVIRKLGIYRDYRYGEWSKFDTRAIEKIVTAMDRWGRSFYMLSYCSPKRARQHTVRIEVRGYKDPRGDPPQVPYNFNAEGFSGGCNSRRVLSDCKFVQCGAPPDKPCHRCAEGLECDRGRCISPQIRAREVKLRKDAARRARQQKAAIQRAYDAEFAACGKERKKRRDLWKDYTIAYRKYRYSDCGPRFLFEGGTSLYPTPQGVAGMVMFGWALPRRVELHAGFGIGPPVYAFVAQVRVKPYSWRFIDLTLVPRFAVGVTSKPRTYEIELLAGIRFRIGRYLALYVHLGPGYAKASMAGDPKVKDSSFVLPAWLGTEVRF